VSGREDFDCGDFYRFDVCGENVRVYGCAEEEEDGWEKLHLAVLFSKDKVEVVDEDEFEPL
jgi:hypothetical protein